MNPGRRDGRRRAVATGPRSCRADRRRRRRGRATIAAAQPAQVPIEFLKPNPRNPRRTFADAELDELADSIRERGIIQPILVRPVRGARTASRSSPASGAGARRSAPACTRCRSSRSKSATTKRWSSRSSKTCSAPISIALEEARGYQALANEYKHSQEDIAKIVGKSRSHVANTLRLLKLPEKVQAFIANGKFGGPRPHADRPARSAGRAKRSSRRASTSARSRRWRRKRASRGVSRKRRAPARGGSEGYRHDRAGEALLRRARPCGDGQSSRPRRHGPDQVPEPRAARRGDAATGKGTNPGEDNQVVWVFSAR